VRTGAHVTGVDASGVTLRSGERIEATTVLWAAGVRSSGLGATLEGAPLDRAGRIAVAPDLSIPARPEVFAIGDMASVTDARSGKPAPGVAPAAMQMGRHAARQIAREVRARRRGAPVPAREPFRYRDKGALATIGRAAAVAELGRVRLTGPLAWLFWALVHVFYLIGFRNRIVVMIQWAWAWVTFNRGARLITGDAALGLAPSDRAATGRAS
jgi:NADH dehydrogenase